MPAQGPGTRPPACPPYVPPAGPIQTTANTQQVIQTYAPRLIAVARPLEQATPGYQVMFALLAELLAPGQTPPVGGQAPGATGAAEGGGQQPCGALADLMPAVLDVNFQHQAALGYMRRFLCGEASGTVLMGLTLALHRMASSQMRLQALLRQASINLPAEQRATLGSLAQILATNEGYLNQAGTLLQQTVGPQLWEPARTQVFGATPTVSGITP